MQRDYGRKNIDKKQYKCPEQVRMGSVVGSASRRGWDVCLTPLDADSIVYSFGIERDLSFELDIMEQLALSHVYSFDPTPYAHDWLRNARRFHRIPDGLVAEPVALAKVDGRITMYKHRDTTSHTVHKLEGVDVEERRTFRAVRLRTIMAKYNHTFVDLIKMDIEGAEWAVLEDILEAPPRFAQLLIEFHFFDSHREINEMVKYVNSFGFRIFSFGERRWEHKKYGGKHGFQEICFIHTDVSSIKPQLNDEDLVRAPLSATEKARAKFNFSARERARLNKDHGTMSQAKEPVFIPQHLQNHVWERRVKEERERAQQDAIRRAQLEERQSARNEANRGDLDAFNDNEWEFQPKPY